MHTNHLWYIEAIYCLILHNMHVRLIGLLRPCVAIFEIFWGLLPFQRCVWPITKGPWIKPKRYAAPSLYIQQWKDGRVSYLHSSFPIFPRPSIEIQNMLSPGGHMFDLAGIFSNFAQQCHRRHQEPAKTMGRLKRWRQHRERSLPLSFEPSIVGQIIHLSGRRTGGKHKMCRTFRFLEQRSSVWNSDFTIACR